MENSCHQSKNLREAFTEIQKIAILDYGIIEDVKGVNQFSLVSYAHDEIVTVFYSSKKLKEQMIEKGLNEGDFVIIEGNLNLFKKEKHKEIATSNNNELQLCPTKIYLLKKKPLYPKEQNEKKDFPKNLRKCFIITGSRSKVYNDFLKEIDESLAGKCEKCEVSMQGPDSPNQIARAIHIIEKQDTDQQDIICIIRGGDDDKAISETFDNTDLCETIRNATVPIYVSIGHTEDHPLAEVVADCYKHTPTALGRYVFEQYKRYKNNSHFS